MYRIRRGRWYRRQRLKERRWNAPWRERRRLAHRRLWAILLFVSAMAVLMALPA